MENVTACPSGHEGLRFTKMHGLGNDYVYLVMEENPSLASLDEKQLSALAREISHRHLGIGGDGMVLISRLTDPGLPEQSFRMRMFNADGSEAQMCGNASRCIALLLHTDGYAPSPIIHLHTLAGVKTLRLNLRPDGSVHSVSVDMGEPVLKPELIPAIADDDAATPPLVTIDDIDSAPLTFSVVSMGNPHAIAFVDEPTDHLVLEVGPTIEQHARFPQKTNVEFATVLDRQNIRMRVWERGTGETMACGTGACATAVAAILRGLTDNHVTLHLPGGELAIELDKNSHVIMTGSATMVARGIYFPSAL